MKDIYWIKNEDRAKIAIVGRPRDDGLEDNLVRLQAGGIDIVVSLLTSHESLDLGLEDERQLVERAGMEFISFPIRDRDVPRDLAGFRQFIAGLAEAVRAGKSVGVHCMGCIGRSTIVTASLLIYLGIPAPDAVAMIEHARGCPVPETSAQHAWIRNFRPKA